MGAIIQIVKAVVNLLPLVNYILLVGLKMFHVEVNWLARKNIKTLPL